MTTVAASLECMAADTRVSNGGVHWHAAKIFRIGDSLFGTAGDGFMSLVMIQWLKGPRSRQALYKQWADYERSDFWLLELNRDGLFMWDGWGVPEKLIDKRFAIGSGQQAAMKGLDRGESPEDAVRGALDYDQYSGAPIQVEWLLPPELKPKRKRG